MNNDTNKNKLYKVLCIDCKKTSFYINRNNIKPSEIIDSCDFFDLNLNNMYSFQGTPITCLICSKKGLPSNKKLFYFDYNLKRIIYISAGYTGDTIKKVFKNYPKYFYKINELK